MLPSLIALVCSLVFTFGVFGIPGLSPTTQLLLVFPVATLFGMCAAILMFLAEGK